ncbi:hypothetical protein [Mycobacterium sp.]|uniref:hypothetical protein n=1 Tax=Mycobacterium sp. TaxID=1785 RepID=UPI002D343782|nr:hypothetical protein [Mycobacterium sp.]HZA09008.1 hypothetical protein [Mycobacterium sp.]
MALNEPPDVLDMHDPVDGADGFDGFHDGRDDGYESDPDEMDGYEPEAYPIAPYEPPPQPWYRTTQAIIAIGAICVAAVALLVSIVLLVFHPAHDREGNVVQPTRIPTTAPPAPTTATATATATATTAIPPPAGTTAGQPAPANTAPVIVQTRENRPTKAPEINVTRTPISVRPSPRAPHPQY